MKFLILICSVLLMTGCLFDQNQNTSRQTTPTPIQINPSQATNTTPVATDQAPNWGFDGTAWKNFGGQAPVCPDPINLASPADVSLATAILYPGQERGGEYKPHGGFRFDGQPNTAITVKAIADASVVRASRYTVNGEIQYTFDFIMPCGIMYRFGHLRVLSAQMQALADQLPPPLEMDSHATFLSPPSSVKAGDVIATSVGITSNQNTFFDFGVYDLRQPNAISTDPTWAALHADDHELAPYSVCWLDWLTPDAAAIVKSLPGGDATAGKKSDYCK